MSISRLSGAAENWVEIGSSSPTSGSTVTFSSIPGYSKLRVIAFNVIPSTNAQIQMTFNNDTGGNYLNKTDIGVTNLNFGSSTGQAFDVEILFNSQITYKRIVGHSYLTGAYEGLWANTDQITEIDLTLNAGTYSSGTFKLYGTN